MSLTLTKLIQQLREQKKYSQEHIAKELGISRSSYISIEQGKRELSLSEAEKLANIFGITLNDLLQGISPNYEKYKQMILAFLRIASPNDGKIPKTKLAKLLYFADFASFYKSAQSMSGMQYRRNHFGPVPDTYFRVIDELEEEGKISIDRKGEMLLISQNRSEEKTKLTELSKEDVELIKDISKKWKNKKTQEIVAFTHSQLPYKLCGSEEYIPYNLIIQEDPDHVY